LNKLLAENSNAIAIGTGAQATAENSISIGTGNIVSGANSGAFGDPNEVSGTGSYAIGNNNTIKANDAFVLGSGVTNEVEGSVVLGNGSTVEKAVATKNVTINGKTYDFAGIAPVSTVSVGSSGKERTITNVAAGRISASSTDAINGSQLYATNLAIETLKTTTDSIASGSTGPVVYTNPSGDRVAKVDGKFYNSTDIENGKPKAGAAEVATSDIRLSAVNADGSTKTATVLGNIADGKLDSASKEAVNGSQLFATNANVATNAKNIANNTTAIADNTANITKNADNITTLGNKVTTIEGDVTTLKTEIGKATGNTTNIVNNIFGKDEKGNAYADEKGKLTAAGTEALTTYNSSGQTTTKNDSIISAIKNINEQGTKFFHVGDGSVKTGIKSKDDSSAYGLGAIAIGMNALAGVDTSAKNAIAIGTGAQATAENSISIGTGNKVSGANSGAFGDPNTVSGTGSYAFGNNNKIEANNAFVLGNDASIAAKNDGAVALGNKTNVTVADGVALGSNSVANRAGGIAGFIPSSASAAQKTAIAATTKGSLGAVSVGNKDATRQITNVAAGSKDSDAVNVAQLKAVSNSAVNIDQLNAGLQNVYNQMGEYRADALAGTASAMAIGNLPQATIPGKGMMALGAGYYESESAMAIGLSKMSDSGKWVFKAAASYDSQENVGAAASVGFHF
ncbi:YadA family autotransporter adhesin, partial [Campylobacter geochelonis]|uniref:YadA family autotransporter adhesin n=1 Tax=Campylobacter geochelonis TaxID=1780362 RepID=UPI001A966E10